MGAGEGCGRADGHGWHTRRVWAGQESWGWDLGSSTSATCLERLELLEKLAGPSQKMKLFFFFKFKSEFCLGDGVLVFFWGFFGWLFFLKVFCVFKWA